MVTGMGVVSCLGHDPDEFYNNLLEVGPDHKSSFDLTSSVQCHLLHDFLDVHYDIFALWAQSPSQEIFEQGAIAIEWNPAPVAHDGQENVD